MTFSVSLRKIKFERAGLAAGWLCFLDLAVLFWPIARNSFLHQLVGVPYPVLIRFHRYAVFTACAHSIAAWLCCLELTSLFSPTPANSDHSSASLYGCSALNWHPYFGLLLQPQDMTLHPCPADGLGQITTLSDLLSSFVQPLLSPFCQQWCPDRLALFCSVTVFVLGFILPSDLSCLLTSKRNGHLLRHWHLAGASDLDSTLFLLVLLSL